MQKKYTLFFMLVFVGTIVFSQTQTPVYLSQSISGASCKGFYQCLPPNYNADIKNYPLIIWVHGAGQVGEGNVADLPKVLEWGVPKIISEAGFPASFTVGDSSFSFIVISPQFTGWPSGGNVGAILNYAMSNYRVDPTRVYLMGISAGGGAAWEFASLNIANSNKLAAMIPFCGAFAPSQTLANRIAAANLPVWAFHNTNDGTVPVAYSRNWKTYINSYTPAPNPPTKLTEFSVISSDAVVAHECWSLATLPSYKPEGINIYEWLLGYRQRTVNANLPPLAAAGQDMGVVLPANAVMDGTSSVDQDGIIIAYKWRKINGPISCTFSDSAAVSPVISNLTEGVYQFELAVTDNMGAVGKDSLTINVYHSLPAGAQQRILIDVGGSANFGGTTSSSPNINGNTWNNMTDARAGVNVSNALTISNQLSGIAIEVINRVDGTYNSASSPGMGNGNTTGVVGDYPASATTDHALIHSSATNGKWRIKGLQTNKIYTIKFWGGRTNTTASRNAEIKRTDDNIWKTYNATSNTNFNNAAVFVVTGKTVMDFDIRTKFGSDFSCINVLDIFYGSDTTIVPANLPPIARAGADTSLQLPIDSLTLRGCASSDPENGLLKYKWKKIAGPASFQIVNDTLCATKIKSLVAGNYSFELAVTDTAGLVAKDSVSVIVNTVVIVPANLPPIARAGADTSLQLPVDSLTLRGCASSDPENGLLKYKWKKIAGPTSFQIVNDTICATKIKNLIAGNYSFELAVTDIAGLTAKDSVSVTVLPYFSVAWPPQVMPICNRAYKIVIVGSSTAYGTGANPIDSSWAKKFRLYLLIQNPQIEVINIATLGLTSYDVSATGTIVPAPFSVDTMRNITKALSLNPDAIILNLPSNDVARGIPTSTIHQNFINITTLANNQNIPVWVSTTQPRDGLSPAEDVLQMDLRDWINSTYGNKAVDFWTGIANADGTINSFYGAGDGVHLNNYGHHILFTRMVEEKIWDTICLRNNVVPNILPIANAGTDISITLPANTTALIGSGTDADGTITSYSWIKISGPSTGTIANANTTTATASGLVQGVYAYQLTVTDNVGGIGRDTMLVTVNAAIPPANILPIANAGNDISLTLPENTTSLTGSGTDADGTIISYNWIKISGPATGTIANVTTATATASGLLQAVYAYQLTVTDNAGGIAKDTVLVTVNAAIPPANILPIANAGNDISLTLPANTTSLTGSGTDADGTIASYNWIKISGPATGTLANATTATATANGLVQGVYAYQLTVTDNVGGIGKDTVLVTVNAAIPPANILPIANAGADISITLPANTTSLTGSGTDADGTIASYNWIKISGPATGTIANITTATATANGLVQGVYAYQLTVTDNVGAVAKDTMLVTVNAQAQVTKKINVNIYGGSNPYNIAQWNNWNMSAGLTSSIFYYDDGSASGVNAVITASGLIADNGATYATTTTICPTQVLRYNSANTSYRTLTLNGFDPAKKYNLEFYASRANTGNSSIYQIGSLLDTISTDSNINDFAKFANISPNSAGKVLVTISRIGTWNYIAGFIIKEANINPATLLARTNKPIANATDEYFEEKIKQNNELLLYPNPARDVITIKLPAAFESEYLVVITNEMGNTVYRKLHRKKNEVSTDLIDIKNLQNGLYILHVQTKTQQVIRKVFKW